MFDPYDGKKRFFIECHRDIFYDKYALKQLADRVMRMNQIDPELYDFEFEVSEDGCNAMGVVRVDITATPKD